MQPVERIGPAAAPDALTVAEYIEHWIKTREGIGTWKDEAARLRLQLVPLIGHMEIADVRPKDIRDLINAIKKKSSDAPKCKGEPLAPRTVRLIYSTVRLVFKSTVIDKRITASPVVLEAGVLPKNVDKDPTWRSTAIFKRDELVKIISDRRIPLNRRVLYSLEGLAGVRQGEAAALRWRDRNKACTPLGKLTVSRSGEKARTKTQITREFRTGWEAKLDRKPTHDVLLVPTKDHRVRKPQDSLKKFHQDLANIGLRARRGHDLRRTFVTLIRVDGGRSEVLRPITHPGEKNIIGLYTTFPWPVVCDELAKLRIEIPASTEANASATEEPKPLEADAAASAHKIVNTTSSAKASYSTSCSPECNPGFLGQIDTLQAAAGMGVPFRKP